MYISGLIICWLIAGVILTAAPKMESNRWYSAAVFVYGFMLLGLTIQNLLPANFSPASDGQSLAGLFYSVTHYFLPYCVLMYALSYALSYTGRPGLWRNLFKGILIIPVISMYIFFPVRGFCNPGTGLFTTIMTALLLWVVPYLVAAVVLLLWSYFQATNKWDKQDRLLVCILIIPCALSGLYIEFLYAFYKLDINEAVKLSLICGVYEIGVILAGIFSYGIFGIKLQSEKSRLNSTMESMALGISFLNHIVKNEILKIAICIENLKTSLHNEAPLIGDTIALIDNGTQRMLLMIDRFQKYMGEYKIKTTPNNVTAIIEDALLSLRAPLEGKRIRVRKNFSGEVIIHCNSVHLKEVFYNIIKNAVEAMEAEGELTIEMNNLNKRVTFAIKDNGPGIDKEDLPHVMEPFFTTKDRKTNFGLGLSYCFNVMQRHGGTLAIYSKKNEGTTVLLNFIKKDSS